MAHLSNVDRIERIRCMTELRLDVTMYTAPVRMFLVKDFYFVTAKLYLAPGRMKPWCAHMVHEFENAVAESLTIGSSFEMNTVYQFHSWDYTVRLVDRNALRLLRAMKRLDDLNHRMLIAEILRKTTRATRRELMAANMQILRRLKAGLAGQLELADMQADLGATPGQKLAA